MEQNQSRLARAFERWIEYYGWTASVAREALDLNPRTLSKILTDPEYRPSKAVRDKLTSGLKLLDFTDIWKDPFDDVPMITVAESIECLATEPPLGPGYSVEEIAKLCHVSPDIIRKILSEPNFQLDSTTAAIIKITCMREFFQGQDFKNLYTMVQATAVYYGINPEEVLDRAGASPRTKEAILNSVYSQELYRRPNTPDERAVLKNLQNALQPISKRTTVSEIIALGLSRDKEVDDAAFAEATYAGQSQTESPAQTRDRPNEHASPEDAGVRAPGINDLIKAFPKYTAYFIHNQAKDLALIIDDPDANIHGIRLTPSKRELIRWAMGSTPPESPDFK